MAVLAIAAITTAIFYFWDDVKGPLTNVINTFITLYNENEGLRVAIGVLKTTFIAAFKVMRGALMAVVDTFQVLFSAIKTALTEGFGAGFDMLVDGLGDIKNQVLKWRQKLERILKMPYKRRLQKSQLNWLARMT